MKVFPLGKEDFWKPKLYWEEVHCWEAERLFICHNGMKPRWEWHGRNPSDCIPSLGETFTLPFLFHSSLSFQYYSWEKQPGLHSPNNKRHHHDLISCLSPSPMNYLPYFSAFGTLEELSLASVLQCSIIPVRSHRWCQSAKVHMFLLWQDGVRSQMLFVLFTHNPVVVMPFWGRLCPGIMLSAPNHLKNACGRKTLFPSLVRGIKIGGSLTVSCRWSFLNPCQVRHSVADFQNKSLDFFTE